MISAHSTSTKLSTITQTSTGPAVSSQLTPTPAASTLTTFTPEAYVPQVNAPRPTTESSGPEAAPRTNREGPLTSGEGAFDVGFSELRQ